MTDIYFNLELVSYIGCAYIRRISKVHYENEIERFHERINIFGYSLLEYKLISTNLFGLANPNSTFCLMVNLDLYLCFKSAISFVFLLFFNFVSKMEQPLKLHLENRVLAEASAGRLIPAIFLPFLSSVPSLSCGVALVRAKCR